MDVEPSDVRFQYEVIRGLSESSRAQTQALLDQGRQLAEILERLGRIEANEVNSRVRALEAKVERMEAERNRRAGMARVGELFVKSPLVGWLVGAGATVWFVISGKAAQ